MGKQHAHEKATYRAEHPPKGPQTFTADKLPERNEGSWDTIPENIIQTHFHSMPHTKVAFVLDHVFSRQECELLIDWSESFGYDKAALGHGTRVAEHVRKSDRCIIDSQLLADVIFHRVQPFLPKRFQGETLINLNERLRFLRYDAGGFFRPHCDGFYVRPDGSEISLITMQLYLNGGFEGGETTFLFDNLHIPCKPKPGRVLIFEHKLRHEGSLLLEGRKYTVRSDFMYTSTKH